MNFGEALELLKKGESVYLPKWDSETRLTLQVPDEHSKMTHPYIYVESRFGRVPWVATQVELLHNDWEKC